MWLQLPCLLSYCTPESLSEPPAYACTNSPDTPPLLLLLPLQGAAQASLAAFMLSLDGFSNLRLFTFGNPQIGDAAWRAAFDAALGSNHMAWWNMEVRKLLRCFSSAMIAATTAFLQVSFLLPDVWRLCPTDCPLILHTSTSHVQRQLNHHHRLCRQPTLLPAPHEAAAAAQCVLPEPMHMVR
jgi:hypothetical protein